MAQSKEEERAKLKEYNRKYYLANIEKRSQQAKERYQRKKEQMLAAGVDITAIRKAHYAEHKDEIKAKWRVWYAANRERIIAERHAEKKQQDI